MESTFRFADILRYILTGAVSLGLLLAVLYLLDPSTSTEGLQGIVERYDALAVLIVVGVAGYLAGVLVQALHYVLGEYSGALRRAWNPFYWCTIHHRASVMSHCTGSDTPDWLQMTALPHAARFSRNDGPARAATAVAEKVEQQNQNDHKNEELYLNEFLLGISVSLWAALLAVVLHPLFVPQAAGTGHVLLAGVLAASLGGVYLLAGMYADRYLHTIHTSAVAADLTVLHTIERHMPTRVFVLIRTCGISARHLPEAVESVMAQDYPLLTILVLEDRLDRRRAVDGRVQGAIASLRERYADRLEERPLLFHSQAHTGAAGAALAVRDLFLQSARPTDVAMLLDDDDRLNRPDAVRRIVARMNATAADIGLVDFQTVSNLDLDIHRIGDSGHTRIVRELAACRGAEPFRAERRYEEAASMGWTKCLRYNVVERYVRGIEAFDAPLYRRLERYEDFPDLVCFLFRSVRITAVEGPLYCYRKWDSSITAQHAVEDFRDCRIGYLLYLRQWSEREAAGGRLVDGANETVERFIRYKLRKIVSIVRTLHAAGSLGGYDDQAFARDCIEAGLPDPRTLSDGAATSGRA